VDEATDKATERPPFFMLEYLPALRGLVFWLNVEERAVEEALREGKKRG